MKGKNQTILGASLAALLALLCSVSVVAAPAHSPNGRIGLQPHANGFDVLYQGRQVLTIADVGVSLSADGKRRPASLSLVASGEGHRVDVDYAMLAGKRLHCTNQYNEYRYTFRDAEGQEQVLVMRLFATTASPFVMNWRICPPAAFGWNKPHSESPMEHPVGCSRGAMPTKDSSHLRSMENL